QSGVGLAARRTCCRWDLSRMIAARWTGSALDFILLARRAIPSSSRRLLLLLLPVSGPGKRTVLSPCTTPAPRAQPPATRGTVRLVTHAHAMGRHRDCESLGSVCTHRLVLKGRDTSTGDPRCAARVHLCGTLAHPVQGVGGPSAFRAPRGRVCYMGCPEESFRFPIEFSTPRAPCAAHVVRWFRFEPAPGSVRRIGPGDRGLCSC